MGNITSGSFLDQTFSQGPQQRGLTQSGQFDQTTGLTDYGVGAQGPNLPYNPYLPPQQNAVQKALQANAQAAGGGGPLEIYLKDEEYDPNDREQLMADKSRVAAAKQLGLTANSIVAPIAAYLTGQPLPAGTYDGLGYMNDGYGGKFDPITGDRVGGMPKSLIANVLGSFGYDNDDGTNGLTPNEWVNAASIAGLPSVAGNQSIADVINAASDDGGFIGGPSDQENSGGGYDPGNDPNMSDGDWYI